MSKKTSIKKEEISNINKKVGTLYIVGTPIGNLKDITLRAIETLNLVDVILAEDTRQTLKLLNHFNISKHLISYHRHNEDEKISNVVDLLESGKSIALVSDAGMPIISDPGENLVKHLAQNGYQVEVIPGPTAVTTAIVKSTIDCTSFAFEGFLSVNKKQRRAKLELLVKECRTIIFYEAPHKLIYTLKDLFAYLGDRKICIARELTKIHEEYIYTTLVDAIKKLEVLPLKGEIVLIVEGVDTNKDSEKQNVNLTKDQIIDKVKEYIDMGTDKKEAIKKVAKECGYNKNDVYKHCLDV